MIMYYVYLDVAGTGYNIFTDPVGSITTDTKGRCLRAAVVNSYRGSVTEACAYVMDALGVTLCGVTNAAAAQADCAQYMGCFEFKDKGENDGN